MRRWFVPSPSPYRPHLPSPRQPLFLVLEPIWRALSEILGRAEGRLLDVGCGMQPYRELLGSGVTGYVGVDREGPLSRPTVFASAEALPFPDASFDVVLATMVLEHVPAPDVAIREAVRLLRPGGKMVLTVPGVWPAHEVPHDYWRFTRHGLERLMANSALRLERLEPLGGLWAVAGQMVNLELRRYALARDLVPLVNHVSRFLDRSGAAEELALAWLAIGVRE